MKLLTKSQINLQSFELDFPTDPLALFQAGAFFTDKSDTGFRAFWSKPRLTLVGIGTAFETTTDDLDSIKALPEDAILIGGNRFTSPPNINSQNNALSDWESFGTSKLVLPKYLVAYNSMGNSTGTHLIQAGTSSTETIEDNFLEIQKIAQQAQQAGPIPPTNRITNANHLTNNLGIAEIREAIQNIKEGRLKKVVLAICERFSISIPLEQLLFELKNKFESCAIFALAIGRQAFFGASPELLLQLDNEKIFTDALAGSAPKSPDPKTDQELLKKLQSPKELAEHKFVVDHIVEKLNQAGVQLDPIPPPAILELPSIRHLHTPISGDVPIKDTPNFPTHILEILGELAPTPAVAGMPTQAALDFIAQAETFDRGWYSGQVGWCTPDGRGEFYTALRSALLSPDGDISLFAGAGIVADSEPEKEIAEMKLKLTAIKDLLDEPTA